MHVCKRAIKRYSYYFDFESQPDQQLIHTGTQFSVEQKFHLQKIDDRNETKNVQNTVYIKPIHKLQNGGLKSSHGGKCFNHIFEIKFTQ